MKFANYRNRLKLVTDAGFIDVASASGGVLPAAPPDAFGRWTEVVAWATGVHGGEETELLEERDLDAPSPVPSQIFAVGLNYAAHAAESGFAVPDYPFVFTKTAASLAPPFGELVLPSPTVDWEVEIVVVMGATADRISASEAWDHVAGLTVGQDYSDREVQNRIGPNQQPTLGKSRAGFAPTGPYLVTPDAFESRDALEISTVINGVDMQRGNSSALIFSIPEIIAYLSSILPLSPGDLIFTGTPAGVGLGRTPPVYLSPGDVIETTVEGIGTIRQVAVAR